MLSTVLKTKPGKQPIFRIHLSFMYSYLNQSIPERFAGYDESGLIRSESNFEEREWIFRQLMHDSEVVSDASHQRIDFVN